MGEKGKRILMTCIGVFVSGFSVGLFDFAAFGVDPFQVLVHGIDHIQNFTNFGTIYMLINVVVLIFALIFDRKKIGLATFINLFFLGYVTQWSYGIFTSLIPEPTLLVRSAFLIVGIVMLCFGTSFYFVGDLGVSTYDAISLIISEKQSKVKFQYCRIISDLICVVIGFMLGGIVGVGTIVTAFFMGPLVVFFRKRFAEPFLYGKTK